MKILMIASEAVPMIKVGGLGDVAGALPKACNTLGHDMRIMIPQYSNLETKLKLNSIMTGLKIDSPAGEQAVELNQSESGQVIVYTLDNPHYFDIRDIYHNDLERYFFFSQAVLKILPRLPWQPEIIHCNDWMTALIVRGVRKYGYPYRSLFTIHNLNYQGNFAGHEYIQRAMGDYRKDYPPRVASVPASLMPLAILAAHEINTVSETYAREITTPEFGADLDNLLRYRQDHLCGIQNGIDTEIWNPQQDPHIPSNYNSETLELKVRNKVALQHELGLTVDPHVPVAGMVQRLDEQKGLDIFLEGIDNFFGQSAFQLIIQGKGRQDYQDRLIELARRYPHKLAVYNGYSDPLAHRIYAGCDMFLLTSRFEPCGLGQMIAMRYGTIPVVRHTGGLVDSVPEFNADLSEGRGFVFHDYSAAALFKAVKRALDTYYYNRKRWLSARERISRLDLSWQNSALKYEELYKKLLNG
jgi:starch synthase